MIFIVRYKTKWVFDLLGLICLCLNCDMVTGEVEQEVKTETPELEAEQKPEAKEEPSAETKDEADVKEESEVKVKPDAPEIVEKTESKEEKPGKIIFFFCRFFDYWPK